MTASENSQEQKLPEKEEFFDAIRRHICQALGFDFVFVDYVREPEIVNLISFSAEDEDKEAREFVDTLTDENQQPLTVANTHVAQNVKKTQRPWIGKAFMAAGAVPPEPDSESDLDDDEDTDGISSEKEGYPYSIVPILQTPHGNAGTVRGLIRVLSFDPTREITQQDLATLKLMGEHLSTKMSQFAPGADAQPAETAKVSFDSEYVLVVHTNRLVRRRYSRILGEKYQVIEADSADKATEALQNNRVDLIVLDSEVKGKSGYAFCRVLKENSQFKHVPVILVTSDTNPTARVDGLNVGADDCLSESCFDSELLARVKSSMRHRKTERELAIQLQLLEDYAQRLEQATEHLSQDKQLQLKRNRELELLRWESDILRSQDTLLHRISNTIRQSFNITENLHKMLEAFSGWFNLDCCFVVLPSEDEPEDSIRSEYYADEEYQLMQQDVDLRTLEVFKKHFQGEQLLMANDAAHDRRLEPFRKDALPNYHFFSLFFVPITYEQKLLGLLGGYKCESQANWNRDNEAFLKSVADQVATGVTNARLYARVQRQATTDGLTGLYNHRTGQEKLAEQLRLAERYQRNLAVVMLDVDHFKSINDNYGHPAGDSVLKAVAKLVKSDCRDVDLPVRYGGEEFLLVLPEVNQEGAAVVAERIRKSLSQEVIHHEDIQISVTGSFGIAAFPEDAHNQQQLLDLADKALYLSKRLGRNQVHTAGDLMFEEISPTKLPEPSRADARQNRQQEDDNDDHDDSEAVQKPSADEKKSGAPTAVSSSTQFTMPNNTYADFVPTAVSPAAEQKEELVPEVVEMVKALATALYSKSDYNKQHHLETARLSELLAKVMGLSQQQVEQIRVAGLLHDVGTLSIPSDLMNKPGKYDEEEREIINQHAVLGAQLLRPIRALRDICEILENHHERWDGTGYPRGLKGEEIPLPARIVAIVDSYHAMISDRPYRPAMTREEAIRTLKKGAGLQWDPFLVDIFVAVLASLNDPRSAPLSAPTPVTPRIEALKDQATNQSAPPSVANKPTEAAEPPVLNARQRLLQHSQQHQPLQVPPSGIGGAAISQNPISSTSSPNSAISGASSTSSTSSSSSPISASSGVIGQQSQSPIAAAPTSTESKSNNPSDELDSAVQKALEEEFDDDFEDSSDEKPDNRSVENRAASAEIGGDEIEGNELDNEPEDLSYPEAVSERSDNISGNEKPAAPSALEQLRRIPPEQQAAMFHQASQLGASELPAHAQPQSPPAVLPSSPATPLAAVQNASAHFIQVQPAVPTHNQQPGLPQQSSQTLSEQPNQQSPQQPSPGQHISQQLPQQTAQGQHISQPLPQQPAQGQHISQPLPQQPAQSQHISQPFPQQPAPQQPFSQTYARQPIPGQSNSLPSSQPGQPAQHTSQPLQQQPQTSPGYVPQQAQQPYAPQAPRQFPQQSAGQQSVSQQSLPQQSAGQQSVSQQSLPQQSAGQQSVSQQSLPQQSAGQQSVSQQSLPQQSAGLQSVSQQSLPQQPPRQQPAPQAMPQRPASQPPTAHNLFPHMQQIQSSNSQSQTNIPAQPYAPQRPPYAVPGQTATPANPVLPQDRQAQPPSPPEQEQKRPSNPDQFYEEP